MTVTIDRGGGRKASRRWTRDSSPECSWPLHSPAYPRLPISMSPTLAAFIRLPQPCPLTGAEAVPTFAPLRFPAVSFPGRPPPPMNQRFWIRRCAVPEESPHRCASVSSSLLCGTGRGWCTQEAPTLPVRLVLVLVTAVHHSLLLPGNVPSHKDATIHSELLGCFQLGHPQMMLLSCLWRISAVLYHVTHVHTRARLHHVGAHADEAHTHTPAQHTGR